MSDVTNPRLIPSVEESKQDKLLIEKGERVSVLVEFLGRDSLELKRLAGKNGLSVKNYVKKIVIDTVRVERKR